MSSLVLARAGRPPMARSMSLESWQTETGQVLLVSEPVSTRDAWGAVVWITDLAAPDARQQVRCTGDFRDLSGRVEGIGARADLVSIGGSISVSIGIQRVGPERGLLVVAQAIAVVVGRPGA